MQQHDLHIYRGDSYRFLVQVSTETGRPLNLDGAEVSMQANPAYAEPLKPHIGVSDGLITLDFPPELTRHLQWRKAPYDVQIRKNGVVKTVLRGFVVLEKDVTP